MPLLHPLSGGRDNRMLDGPDDPRHGTLNGYNRHKCHCVRCREAKSAAERRRRQAMPKEQRRAIEAARPARPRTAADKERARSYIERRQQSTAVQATEHHRRWSAEDVQTALRSDLTVWEAAELLGRTGSAVANVRHRFRKRGSQ